MKALRVGLTGGIAAGKSTVARWLQEAGFQVVDADSLVAELYRPAGAGAEIVERLLGRSCLQVDGGVDHRQVAERVFSDPRARHELESAIHPLVREGFAAVAKDTSGVVILEATLLAETGFATDFDFVVTVEADTDLRLQRAVARGLDEAAVRDRLAAQSDPATRMAAADRVLWNNGTLDDLRRQVDLLIEELKGRSPNVS